jgi:Pyruvate/2-oxoacid:ferredoxin oxidoreductase delta subunit
MTSPPISRRDFLRIRVRLPLVGSTERVACRQPRAGIDGTSARLAQIDLRACLASIGQLCTVCAEHCGARGALQLRGLYPEVDVARCTGCGACADACPAPRPAIRLIPAPPRDAALERGLRA